MRIVFFGLPLAALLLLVDGHELPLAVVCRKDALGLRRLRRVLGRERVVVRGEVSERTLRERVLSCGAELLVSWFWTAKLPMDWVRAAPLGGIGAHPSLLPRHRGPDPYFAVIDGGEAETGITVHRIAEGYDTGEMLGQMAVRVPDDATAWSLARLLDRPSLQLLRSTVMKLARGEPIAEVPQDERLATWAAEPSEDDCALNWTWPSARLLRRIRALAPSPGAYTHIGESSVTLFQARIALAFPKVLAPGEAWVGQGADSQKVAVVRTADGALELVAGEAEGALCDANELLRMVERAGEK